MTIWSKLKSRGCLLTTAYGVPVLLVSLFLLGDLWWTLDYELAANIAIAVLAVAVNVFTILYGFRSNWRANRIGRIFLRKCVFLSLVLNQIVFAVWFDSEYPGRQHVRFAIYALGAIAYVAMVISLWHEQQNDRRELEQEL